MIVKEPLEAVNGIISCPTCATGPQYYLQHSKKTISSIEIPSYEHIKIKKKSFTELQLLIIFVGFSIILVSVLSLFNERE